VFNNSLKANMRHCDCFYQYDWLARNWLLREIRNFKTRWEGRVNTVSFVYDDVVASQLF